MKYYLWPERSSIFGGVNFAKDFVADSEMTFWGILAGYQWKWRRHWNFTLGVGGGLLDDKALENEKVILNLDASIGYSF